MNRSDIKFNGAYLLSVLSEEGVSVYFRVYRSDNVLSIQPIVST